MFNQIFSKKVVVPFFQFVGVISIFTFIVFPGLTAADTIVNIFSAIIGFFTMLAGFYMVTNWFQKYDSIELTKEQSEKIVSDIKDKGLYTEPKKKREPKSKPLVEGSSKSQTKGDTGSTQTVFSKRETVLGEFQINNKEKVRKSTTKVK